MYVGWFLLVEFLKHLLRQAKLYKLCNFQYSSLVVSMPVLASAIQHCKGKNFNCKVPRQKQRPGQFKPKTKYIMLNEFNVVANNKLIYKAPMARVAW